MKKIGLVLASLLFLVGCEQKDDNSSFLSLSSDEEVSNSIEENDNSDNHINSNNEFSTDSSNSNIENSEEESMNSYNFYSEDSDEDISWGEIV